MGRKRKQSTEDPGSSKKPKLAVKKGGSKGGKAPKSQTSKSQPQASTSTGSGGATGPDPINNLVTWLSSPQKWQSNLPNNHGKPFSADPQV